MKNVTGTKERAGTVMSSLNDVSPCGNGFICRQEDGGMSFMTARVAPEKAGYHSDPLPSPSFLRSEKGVVK